MLTFAAAGGGRRSRWLSASVGAPAAGFGTTAVSSGWRAKFCQGQRHVIMAVGVLDMMINVQPSTDILLLRTYLLHTRRVALYTTSKFRHGVHRRYIFIYIYLYTTVAYYDNMQ